MKHICKYRTQPVATCPRPHSCPYAEIEVGHCTYAEEEDEAATAQAQGCHHQREHKKKEGPAKAHTEGEGTMV